jgi:cell division protein ZapE
MPRRLRERLESLIADGWLEADPAQLEAALKLDALGVRLAEAQLARKGSALGWLFGRKAAPEAVRGLYIWGSVGRGKTMLMDQFYELLAVRSKRRAHFHAFMRDVHERIHEWRQAARRGETSGSDPVAPVAEALAGEAQVLCFDEFSVTDIADAMLLGRLFEALFARGVTVVATSNVEPSQLYRDGLNRALFLPFIRLIEERLEVFRLDARTDYRMEKLAGEDVYITPGGPTAHGRLKQVFDALTGGSGGQPVTLRVKGRDLVIPRAAQGVAWLSFDELCDRPLGASDYLEIAEKFHTVLIEDVPAMDQETRNQAKRFITLIDVFYDNGVKTVISAETPADRLYRGVNGAEAFEFNRTVSRLNEMRSQEYLSRPHGTSDAASGDTTGLVET